MIDIKVIASGSTGNCYRISDGETTLMIECGIRLRQIRQAFDFQLAQVAGCLISHCHGDHAMAIRPLMKAGIDCYLSKGTADQLKVSGHRAKVVKPHSLFQVETFKILPFDTQHDCPDPLGFLLQSESGEKLLFITDSYYCKYRFSGVNYFMVECNYSMEILEENIKSGITPPEIRNRIVKSHFELERVKEFFRVNNHPGIREIHLIHLSGGNSDPDLFKSEIQKITGKPVYVHRQGGPNATRPGGGTSLNNAATGRGGLTVATPASNTSGVDL